MPVSDAAGGVLKERRDGRNIASQKAQAVPSLQSPVDDIASIARRDWIINAFQAGTASASNVCCLRARDRGATAQRDYFETDRF